METMSNLGTGTRSELTAYQLQAYMYIPYSYTPPQVGRSPSIFVKCFAFAFGSAFVNCYDLVDLRGEDQVSRSFKFFPNPNP